ncbi:hypothetical protein BDV28DRAFT_127169 [Aspergillus coremiiformis]|uniref:DUF7600 domain-containing protein n=1 Tax=Aspergillus coremiiformis TaxID=138285 RepID=A0A5N6ZHG9_9EURO|nr:hypothetical protein BDV28DRAFT_127169 [Aspergillus coremiiformis]
MKISSPCQRHIVNFSVAMTLCWQYIYLPWTDSHPAYNLPILRTSGNHSYYFSLPSSLRHIAVSVLTGLDETYITGMEFIGQAEKVSVGHIIPQNRIISDIEQFRGVDIASTREGFHAIRFNNIGVSKPPWIGTVTDSCFVCNLPLKSYVSAFKVEFDEFKIITFGFATIARSQY